MTKMRMQKSSPDCSILHACHDARTGAGQSSHGDCFFTFWKIEPQNMRSCREIPDLIETKIFRTLEYTCAEKISWNYGWRGRSLRKCILFRWFIYSQIILKRTNVNGSIARDRLSHHINNVHSKHWFTMIVGCPRARWLASSVAMVTKQPELDSFVLTSRQE